MRCIHCQKNNNRRARLANNGCCSDCGHAFAFDPQDPSAKSFTDKGFATLIKALSANHGLYFTATQLHYAILRKSEPEQNATRTAIIWVIYYISIGSFLESFPSLGNDVFSKATSLEGFFVAKVGLNYTDFWIPIALLIGTEMLTSKPYHYSRHYWLKSVLIFALTSLMLVNAMYWHPPSNIVRLFLTFIAAIICFRHAFSSRRYIQPWPVSTSAELYRRFDQIHGAGGHLLPPADHDLNQLISASDSPYREDVSSYSFDRVLFCQSATVAQFLIANHFHFEHNCGILTADGYPQPVYENVIEMLKKNDELKVFCVHDCTPYGVLFLSQLRSSQPWIQEANLTVCDLGLLPRHILRQPGKFFVRRSKWSDRDDAGINLSSGQLGTTLQPRELQWLKDGFYVELESIAPQRLLQYLSRGVVAPVPDEQLRLDDALLYNSATAYLALDSFG